MVCFYFADRHGHRWYEWDPTKWCINVWYYLGLASDLYMTPENTIKQSQVQVKQQQLRQLDHAVAWPTPVKGRRVEQLAGAFLFRLLYNLFTCLALGDCVCLLQIWR